MTPLTEDQRALVEANLGLAWHLALGYRRSARLHTDDRLSAAIEGLVTAALGYDESRGQFAAYAGLTIRRHLDVAIWDDGPIQVPKHVRTGRTTNEAIRLSANRAQTVGCLTGPMPVLGPQLGILDALAEAEDAASAPARAAALLDRLEPRARSALILRFGLDGRGPRTLAEVGTELGCSRELARLIEREALATLREVGGP